MGGEIFHNTLISFTY